MTAANVWVSVTDPDDLLAGTSPAAHFVASHVQLYRYTSEGNARLNSGGTLVTSFALLAGSTALTDEAGPFRFGYYDSGQSDDSWYATRYRDSGSSNFSLFSYPFQAGGRRGTTLKDPIFEVGSVMGNEVKRGTVTAGAAATLTCAALFKSSLVDSRWFRGHYLYVEYDAGGAAAAPEKDERLIASVDTSSGIATVDNDFSAIPASGDTFQVHALVPPSELIRCINRVRERMFLLVYAEIAVGRATTSGNRYPVPQGIRSKADVIDCQTVFQQASATSKWQSISDTWFDIEFDGLQGWLVLNYTPDTDIIRLRYEKSFRELEGEMSLMLDVTRAPIEWMRMAAAWEAYQWLDNSDMAPQMFGKLVGKSADDVKKLSGRYAPSYTRPLLSPARERIGPRPVRF